jgi:hypothetical protein
MSDFLRFHLDDDSDDLDEDDDDPDSDDDDSDDDEDDEDEEEEETWQVSGLSLDFRRGSCLDWRDFTAHQRAATRRDFGYADRDNCTPPHRQGLWFHPR